MGRRAPFDRQAVDLLRNIVPIATQGLIKGGDYENVEQLYKATGGNVYRYKTEAEKLAERYASDRMPTGPVDPQYLRAHQRDIRLEDAFRKGQIGKGELLKYVDKRRADEIVRRAPMTPLQARFDRLPISEAVNVWDAANKTEKAQLKSLLWKKRVSYLKQHSAVEREFDDSPGEAKRVSGHRARDGRGQPEGTGHARLRVVPESRWQALPADRDLCESRSATGALCRSGGAAGRAEVGEDGRRQRL